MLKQFLAVLKTALEIDSYWASFIGLAKRHPYVAILAATPAVWFIGGFVVEQCLELAERLKTWSETRQGRVRIGLSIVFSVALAVALVAAARMADQARPVLINVPAIVVAKPLFLQWTFANDDNEVVYRVQSARDQAFTQQTFDEDTVRGKQLPILRQINDVRYWRVRAERFTSGGQLSPLSDWSEAVQVPTYDSLAERIRRTRRIRIGLSTEVNQAFFTFFEKAQAAGVDVELVNRIVERLPGLLNIPGPLQTDLVYHGFDDLLLDPRQGNADIIAAAISKRADRIERFGLLFSDSYYQTSLSLIARCEPSNSANPCAMPGQPLKDAILGKRVAVQKETTSDAMLQELLKKESGGLGVTVLRAEQFNASLALLLEEPPQVDFVVADTPFALAAQYRSRNQIVQRKLMLNELPPAASSGEEYALAVRNSETELLRHINTVLRELRDRGELNSILSEADKRYQKAYLTQDARNLQAPVDGSLQPRGR